MQSRIYPPPFTHAHAFQSVGGQVPYFNPGFNAVYLKKKMYRYAQCTSEPSNGSRLALVVEAGLKADDNWNMKICNDKQYMYFTCTFALQPHLVNYKTEKSQANVHNSRILCIN